MEIRRERHGVIHGHPPQLIAASGRGFSLRVGRGDDEVDLPLGDVVLDFRRQPLVDLVEPLVRDAVGKITAADIITSRIGK